MGGNKKTTCLENDGALDTLEVAMKDYGITSIEELLEIIKQQSNKKLKPQPFGLRLLLTTCK